MKYNKALAEAFLDSKDNFDRERASAFLEGKTGLAVPEDNLDNKTLPSEFQIPGGYDPAMNEAMLQEHGQLPEPKPAPPPQDDRTFFQKASDYPAAINQEILKLIGLPADLWEWAGRLIGAESIMGNTGLNSRNLTHYGANLGVNYEIGKEPDTAGTKMGEYTALGLEFLAPFLRMGRAGASTTAAKAETEIEIPFINRIFKGGEVNARSAGAIGSQQANKITGVVEGVSQRIAAPFQQAPKLALAGELAGSGAAGIGAYYGGKEFGDTGEMIGGLIGGPLGQLSLMATPRLSALAKRQLFPYSPEGGKMKAGQRIRSLAETEEVAKNIDKAATETLPNSNIPPAKLSGDRQLINLQNRVLEDDPALAHEFLLEETRINTMARDELKSLGNQVPIEKTQAYLAGRVERISGLIDRRVDLALKNASNATENLNPVSRRKIINVEVNREIQKAMSDARAVEKEAWSKVPFDTKTKITDTTFAYKDLLDERTVASDTSEIPKYVETLLGKMEKGKFVQGKLDSVQEVKVMQDFRSRLLNSIREEKAKDAVNWNKVRILDDLQEAVLNDMAKPEATGIEEAIAVSRKLNEKFKGGVMSVIFGNERTGGRIAPEVALESINSGPKAAVEIQRVIDASPESYGKMEDLIKLKIASESAGIVKNGRINVDKAKKYLDRNEDVFDIFPDLKSQMEKAIGLEERAIGISKRAKLKQGQLAKSSAARIASVKPGIVFKTILESPYPEREMKKLWSQSNPTGKRGLVNDAVNHLLKKSRISKFDESEVSTPLLSGKKLSNEWDQNKGIYNQIFTKAERHRIKLIENTLKKNDKLTDMPGPLENVVDPGNKVLRWVAGLHATRIGAQLGGSSGASLKTASMASKVSNQLIDALDTAKATDFIKAAIQDPELFKVLMADTTKLPEISRAWKIFQGWMVGTAVDSLEEK